MVTFLLVVTCCVVDDLDELLLVGLGLKDRESASDKLRDWSSSFTSTLVTLSLSTL